MEDKDIVHELKIQYIKKFGLMPPPIIMMESMETYAEELRKAIKRGRPIQEGERPKCDIID